MSLSGKREERRRLQAMKVHQWLPEWEEVEFDDSQYRTRPPENFYLFTLPASELLSLSGIFRRDAAGGQARSRDLGIQRQHDTERSEEIREYVSHGFPWSALSNQRRTSGDFDDLKKPGWLPTAIVVNILKSGDTRRGESVHSNDLIEVGDETDSTVELILPSNLADTDWHPSGLAPIEVIDGQHRLWAFDDRQSADGFSLPVVAFYGLDISWQAYLFYTINIKPKKINTSLAFDLYPLLRTEDWLERFDGHPIYRETRAQEITEALWSYPDSPWHDRIDMLGGRGNRMVTQAAWIRSLLATFVKSYENRRVNIGGLFGAPLGEHHPVLGWSRPQQSAFIIFLWQQLQDAVAKSKDDWAVNLREEDSEAPPNVDAAFSRRFSLLNTDQGVRGVLSIFNDLCYVQADHLKLDDLESSDIRDGTAEGAISNALEILAAAPVGAFVKQLAGSLASYDWRTSGTPGLSERLRSEKARFRGGTGYRELRSDLLHHVAAAGGDVANVATEVINALGF
ncbi:MAG: DGQHR domain-containing protein [Acidimicrobiales bacterium]